MEPQPPSHRHHYYSFRSAELLPFLDGVFAVAFTLVALSLPDQIRDQQRGLGELALLLSSSALSSLAVLLYWFKTRRLVVPTKLLYLPQLLLLFLSLLVIVTLPQMAALALRYGQGSGSVFEWTDAQAANLFFLGVLFVFDALVLGFTLSLRHHPLAEVRRSRIVRVSIRAQSVGLAALIVLAVMEMLFIWFNSQYIVLVPLVLLAEELLTARWMGTG